MGGLGSQWVTYVNTRFGKRLKGRNLKIERHLEATLTEVERLRNRQCEWKAFHRQRSRQLVGGEGTASPS